MMDSSTETETLVGSPVMVDIFEEGKPMVFCIWNAIQHYQTLVIVPKLKRIGFLDGLKGQLQRSTVDLLITGRRTKLLILD